MMNDEKNAGDGVPAGNGFPETVACDVLLQPGRAAILILARAGKPDLPSSRLRRTDAGLVLTRGPEEHLRLAVDDDTAARVEAAGTVLVIEMPAGGGDPAAIWPVSFGDSAN